MSTQIPSRPMSGLDQRESPWASGLTVVAATFLVIGGIWQALAGLAAVIHDDVYLSTPQYIYSFDLTAWGWIHMLLGVLMIVAGVAAWTSWTLLDGTTLPRPRVTSSTWAMAPQSRTAAIPTAQCAISLRLASQSSMPSR